MRKAFWAFCKDEQGQDLVEYALVMALIAFAAMVGMNAVASNINSAFNSLATAIQTYVKVNAG